MLDLNEELMGYEVDIVNTYPFIDNYRQENIISKDKPVLVSTEYHSYGIKRKFVVKSGDFYITEERKYERYGRSDYFILKYIPWASDTDRPKYEYVFKSRESYGERNYGKDDYNIALQSLELDGYKIYSYHNFVDPYKFICVELYENEPMMGSQYLITSNQPILLSRKPYGHGFKNILAFLDKNDPVYVLGIRDVLDKEVYSIGLYAKRGKEMYLEEIVFEKSIDPSSETYKEELNEVRRETEKLAEQGLGYKAVDYLYIASEFDRYLREFKNDIEKDMDLKSGAEE